MTALPAVCVAGFGVNDCAPLVETMLIAFGGGALGLLLGTFGVDLVTRLGASQLPLGTTISFDARMAAFNTVSFASGRYTGGSFSTSVDSMNDFRRLPKGYAGGISTDRIDVLSQILKR